MREALTELDVEDIEHPDVSLVHETGWRLGAYPSGLLIWENLESGAPRHMRGVSRDEVLKMWQSLSRGELAAIRPGLGCQDTVQARTAKFELPGLVFVGEGRAPKWARKLRRETTMTLQWIEENLCMGT